MKKRVISILMILCVAFMLFSFTACSDKEKSDAPAIVGKGEYESSSDMSYTFREDGTGSYWFLGSETKFVYEDDGKALTLQYENIEQPNVFEYKIEGKKLLIQDSFGEFMTYIKK